MANILLVDPSEIARLAMRGILERGRHRLALANTADEAWEFIRRTVKVDVVVTELKVPGGGLELVQRLKADSFLKLLPIVIYTEHGDRDAVRQALELRVQNFLIKPYQDDAIYAEIAKATTNPWRARHFEEEKSFCKLMGFEPLALHAMLEELRTALIAQRGALEQSAAIDAEKAVGEQLATLSAQAEAAGAWGVVDCLAGLNDIANARRWPEFVRRLDNLALADRVIFRHLNPTIEPPEFLSATEADAENAAATRAHWINAPAENRCPVVTPEELFAALDKLTGCPVVDSAAAAFQMSATGHPDCLSPLMDLVERDPGLATQMLIAANQVCRQGDDGSQPIDDPRLAIGILGETRLVAQARALLTVPERQMQATPYFNWPRFWMFQNGTARLARHTCQLMEFQNLESVAHTAGLLHDLGRLLLFRLHTAGFHAIMEFARLHKVPLRVAEEKFLGCTTRDLAAHFAGKNGLPRPYLNVMRWVDTPKQATEDIELVAAVSLARDFCRHNHLGASGEPPEGALPPIDQTEAWSVVRERVFPSFNLRKYELQMHADCHELKITLQGRLKNSA